LHPLDLQGKPGLESELNSVKKLAPPKLKELCKQLKADVRGTTKPELLEAIFSRLNASRTPDAVRELTNLKALADSQSEDFRQIEEQLDAYLGRFDEDEMIRIAVALDVILPGRKTRKLALEGIRRKILAKQLAKKLIAY
jgi:hypothetical protein